MTRDERIEAVAREMARWEWEETASDEALEAFVDQEWRCYVPRAKAAILATLQSLLNPDPETFGDDMMNAFASAYRREAAEFFNAAIQQAIKEME